MSYILDALRKSEQERKALNAQPVSELAPLTIKTDSVWKFRWAVLILALINLIGLGYLYVKFQQPVVIKEPAIAVSTRETIPEPAAHPDVVVLENAALAPLGTEKAISDLMEENQEDAEAELDPTAPSNTGVKNIPHPAKRLPKPTAHPKEVVVKASVSQAQRFTQPASEKDDDERTMAILRLKDTLIEKPKPAYDTENFDSTKPLLTELSEDFQKKVDISGINVFAYAENPKERFVIIDMVKYTVGERIKQKSKIVNILPNNVLLNYEGQDFRIARP